VSRFAADASGATAIEYAMIASLISIIIIGWAGMIGQTLDGIFQSLIGVL
jgi:pilus assembly protein Flp/PilA